MQLTAILVAALSASTLTSALPTDLNSTDPSAYNEEAEHGLQKRDTFGWISSFQGSDSACTGQMAKRRPQIHALECVKFKATSQRVGINWGTGMYSFSSLAVYSDRDCKQMIGHVEGPKDHNQFGPQSCVDPKQYGGVWLSVKISGMHISEDSGKPIRRPVPLDLGYGTY